MRTFAPPGLETHPQFLGECSNTLAELYLDRAFPPPGALVAKIRGSIEPATIEYEGDVCDTSMSSVATTAGLDSSYSSSCSGRSSHRSSNVSSASNRTSQGSALRTAPNGSKSSAVEPKKVPVGVPLTTVMMRNIPKEYSRTTVLEILDGQGFNGCYDFIYLPIDFRSNISFGYAFINFVTSEEAERFREHFQDFYEWSSPSDKVCDVTWSDIHHGLAAHVDRYRSSPVMHEDMPDECKPAVFHEGARVAFPPPLKKIRPITRASRIRHRT